MFLFFIASLDVSLSSRAPVPIEQFYKKITNKTAGHSMRNIDFIYMINLDHRPEKFDSCLVQLAPYNITPFRFSAVNGREISFETIKQLGVKLKSWMKKKMGKNTKLATTYLSKDRGAPRYEIMNVKNRVYFDMELGPLGCILSHLSVLYDAYYYSGYNTIWVIEDDIEVIRDPHLVSDAIEKLDALVGKDGWDILFTDKDTKNQQGNYVSCWSCGDRPNFTPSNSARFSERNQISPDFIKIGARYGSYSMIIRRSGMKKILDFVNAYKIFLPYDLDYILPDDIRLYTVVEDIVSTQPQAISDNR
jgi:GR25 family glycosyltransferase involved in LPS biosynthesis